MSSKLTAKAVQVLFYFAILTFSLAVQAAGINIQNVNFDEDGGQLIIKGKIEGFGDGVTVLVKNLSTGHVLVSGESTKHFSYKIPINSFNDVPCEVLVIAGTESATATVKHGPGGCSRYEYVLTGIVTDEPIPNATVSVTLDGVTYTTTADELGNYELPIISANLNQLVKIDASAIDPETGDSIDFVNLAGSFSRVLDGNASGNVTNVSTASYILAVEANGGTEPTTPEELQTAETSIDATELFELSALIKLIVDDKDYSLPDGETSLIAFISDPAAVETYMETVPQEDLEAALAEILSDSNLVAGFTETDVPELYYAIPVSSPGFIARNGNALEFNEGAGTGTILGIAGNSGIGIEEDFSWSIDVSGRLVIEFDLPIVTQTYPSVDSLEILTAAERQLLFDNGISQIEEVHSTNGYTYTRVTDGTLVDIASLETRSTITYPPIPLGDGSTLTLTESTAFEINTDEVTLRSSLDVEPIPITDTCPGSGKSVCAVGTWAGIFHYTSSPGVSYGTGYNFPATAYGEILSFASNGTLSATLSGSTGSWSVNADGFLVVSFDDGWTQTMQILDSLGIEHGIYSEYTNGTDRYASYTVYSRADVRPVLAASDIISEPNRYFNGEVNSWLPGSFDENGIRIVDRRFGWQLYADGSGFNRQWYYGFGCTIGAGVNLWLPEITWEIAEGNLEIDRRPWNPGTRVRTWHPAATTTINGDRVLYVLESELIAAPWAGGEMRPLFPPRINIQREIDEHNDFDCQIF